MTAKKPVRKRPRKPLAERIDDEQARSTAPVEEEVPVQVQGPVGNNDYIEHGSENHATLLDLDPETGELLFDTSSATDRQAEEFKTRRQRILAAGAPQMPPGTPPMWDPEDYSDVEEVG